MLAFIVIHVSFVFSVQSSSPSRSPLTTSLRGPIQSWHGPFLAILGLNVQHLGPLVAFQLLSLVLVELFGYKIHKSRETRGNVRPVIPTHSIFKSNSWCLEEKAQELAAFCCTCSVSEWNIRRHRQVCLCVFTIWEKSIQMLAPNFQIPTWRLSQCTQGSNMGQCAWSHCCNLGIGRFGCAFSVFERKLYRNWQVWLCFFSVWEKTI